MVVGYMTNTSGDLHFNVITSGRSCGKRKQWKSYHVISRRHLCSDTLACKLDFRLYCGPMVSVFYVHNPVDDKFQIKSNKEELTSGGADFMIPCTLRLIY